jgi:hypothetical protein
MMMSSGRWKSTRYREECSALKTAVIRIGFRKIGRLERARADARDAGRVTSSFVVPDADGSGPCPSQFFALLRSPWLRNASIAVALIREREGFAPAVFADLIGRRRSSTPPFGPARNGEFIEPDQSDLPVGRRFDFPVQPLLQKYFTSPVGQIISTTSRHPTPQGAYHDRHERGVGCGGRGSVLRATGSQGGSRDP